MVAVVRSLDSLQGLAAVDALEQRNLREKDHVGVLRMNGQRGEVPRPLLDAAAGVDELQVLAAVVAAEQAALLGLDQRVDAPRIGWGDGQADLAPDALGQALAASWFPRRHLCRRPGNLRGRGNELRPGVAAVAGDVQPAAGAAAGQVPRPPPRLPQAGEEDARIVRVEADVRGAGVGVLGQHPLPGLAAVGGAVDAALLIGAEALPRTAAKAMSGLVGWTIMVPIWPSCFQTCFQVLPASVEL